MYKGYTKSGMGVYHSTNGEPYPLGNLTVGPRFPVTLNNFDQFNKVKL